VGPLPRAQPQFQFLLVATDYLTKWIKVVPFSEVTGQQVIKFLWQNVVCRFGLPHTIISDRGTNFAIREVATFCAKYKITYQFSILYYSQGNDQAETSNHTILDSLCKSLGKAKGKWVKRLPGVLWAYRTKRISIPMRETPFSVAYRTDVIIPVDICMQTKLIGTRMPLNFAWHMISLKKGDDTL